MTDAVFPRSPPPSFELIHFRRDKILPLTLGVIAIACLFFANIAVFLQFAPYWAIGGFGGAALTGLPALAIQFCSQPSHPPVSILTQECENPSAPEPDSGPPSPEPEIQEDPSTILTPEEGRQRILDILPPVQANLIDGSPCVTSNSLAGWPSLPYIGIYEQHYGTTFPSQHLVKWRLPSPCLTAFPEEMQRICENFAREDKLDLFFLVTKDVPGPSLRRNLVMHHLILPDYDPQNPTYIANKPMVYPWQGGVATQVNMQLFHTQGIKQVEGSFLTGAPQTVNFHPTYDAPYAISPNNANFSIESEETTMCSYYLGATYRGRACAFFMILVREEESELETAVANSDNLTAFLENLEGSPYYETISSLLSFL